MSGGGRIYRQIARFVASAGDHGATIDEIATFFLTPPNHISGQVNVLSKRNLVTVRAGQARQTRTGRFAYVWVARPPLHKLIRAWDLEIEALQEAAGR